MAMNKMFAIMVMIGVPVSVAGALLHWPNVLMFAVYCLTIIALASFIKPGNRKSRDYSGPRIGGLLNATFGNAVELIISLFSLAAGLHQVVLASLTGSVLGNLLLVAGMSFFWGPQIQAPEI